MKASRSESFKVNEYLIDATKFIEYNDNDIMIDFDLKTCNIWEQQQKRRQIQEGKLLIINKRTITGASPSSFSAGVIFFLSKAGRNEGMFQYMFC